MVFISVRNCEYYSVITCVIVVSKIIRCDYLTNLTGRKTVDHKRLIQVKNVYNYKVFSVLTGNGNTSLNLGAFLIRRENGISSYYAPLETVILIENSFVDRIVVIPVISEGYIKVCNIIIACGGRVTGIAEIYAYKRINSGIVKLYYEGGTGNFNDLIVCTSFPTSVLNYPLRRYGRHIDICLVNNYRNIIGNGRDAFNLSINSIIGYESYNAIINATIKNILNSIASFGCTCNRSTVLIPLISYVRLALSYICIGNACNKSIGLSRVIGNSLRYTFSNNRRCKSGSKRIKLNGFLGHRSYYVTLGINPCKNVFVISEEINICTNGKESAYGIFAVVVCDAVNILKVNGNVNTNGNRLFSVEDAEHECLCYLLYLISVSLVCLGKLAFSLANNLLYCREHLRLCNSNGLVKIEIVGLFIVK